MDPSALARANSVDSGLMLLIDTSDGRATYASTPLLSQTRAGTYSVAPWRCPPGVHTVAVGAQIINATVRKNRPIWLTNPTFAETSTPAAPSTSTAP